MAKLSLNDVASGYNRSKINTNFTNIETELNDKVLYRDNPSGEANQMENDLDMNSNDILNIGRVTTQALILNGAVLSDTTQVSSVPVVETVYTITHSGTVNIEPGNGGIQLWELTSNATVTESFDEGESVTLIVTKNANDITWPSMKWQGGSAPTLSSSDESIVELFKAGTTLYGAGVGDFS